MNFWDGPDDDGHAPGLKGDRHNDHAKDLVPKRRGNSDDDSDDEEADAVWVAQLAELERVLQPRRDVRFTTPACVMVVASTVMDYVEAD